MAVSAACFGGGLVLGAVGIYTHNLPLLYGGYGILGGCGIGIGYTPPLQVGVVRLAKRLPKNSKHESVLRNGTDCWHGSSVTTIIFCCCCCCCVNTLLCTSRPTVDTSIVPIPPVSYTHLTLPTIYSV